MCNITKLILITLIILAKESQAMPYDVVPEGHRGIYYRFGGKLLEKVTLPGIYLKMPYPITMASEIQVTPQTDVIHRVKCGAGDGTQMSFETVEVGNHLNPDGVYETVKRFGENYDKYLIKDKVRHQINVICSGMTSQEIYIEKFDQLDDQLKEFLQEEIDKLKINLSVDFVRLSKPTLPQTLQQNYDKIANEKTALKALMEEKKRLAQENENKIMVAKAEGEARRIAKEKDNQIAVEKKKADEEMASIENRIHIEKEKAKADAVYYSKAKMAEGNKELLTEKYVQLESAKSLANNAKHYFGEIPKTLFLGDMDSQKVKSSL